MSLTLRNFDEANDEVTQRGREYYTSGAVKTLDEISGDWIATVVGSQEYEVEISLRKSIITSTTCPCYFFKSNNYCKHIAATLFAVRDRLSKPAKTKIPKEPKIKSPLQQLHHAAESIDERHLRDFIKTHAIHNKEFINSFLFHAKQLAVVNDASEDNYRELIRLAIESSTSRRKKTSEVDDATLAGYMRPLLEQARRHLADQNYVDATAIIRAMIEELTLLRESTFTGERTLKMYLQAFEFLQSVAVSHVPYIFKDDLFDFCLAKSDSGIFTHTILEPAFNTLLLHLAIDNQKRAQLLRLMDRKIARIVPNSPALIPYHYQRTWLDYITIKLDILYLMKRDDDAWQLIKEECPFHEDIRKTAIEYAIQQRDYTYAKKLVTDKLDDMKATVGFHRYSKTIWHTYLLQIAEAEKSIPDIIQYALRLFQDTGEISYYRTAAKQLPAKEWKAEINALLGKVRTSYNALELLGRIYVEEGMLDELFNLIKKHANIYLMRAYINVLSLKYRKEILSLYKYELLDFAQNAATNNYPIIRDHLNNLIDLGATDTVSELLEEYRAIYKGRPKFMEQLDKVKLVTL